LSLVELNGIEPSACRSDRSPWIVDWESYNIPFAVSSSLPLTDLKYLSLEAASDRVAYSSL